MENNEIKKEIAQVVDDFEKALKERDKQEAFKIEGHWTQEQIDAIKDSMKITNQMEQALRYNNGKPQWSLVDFDSLEGLVHVLEYGADKYSIFENSTGVEVKGADIMHIPNFKQIYKVKISGKDNWKKGLELKSILDSAMRHLIKMMNGELIDEESKLLHAHHVICNMMFWVHFYKKNSL